MRFKISPINIPGLLSRNKIINIVVVMVYFIWVVLPHKWVGNLIAKSFQNYSRQTYQTAMLLIAVAFIIIYLVYLFWILRRRQFRFKSLFLLVVLFALCALSYPLLIIHYVEAIHFLQYAILAFLLFPLLKNYYKLMFWGLILATVDEGYQYFYLAPGDTTYLDFNDIILNQLGLILGVFPFALKGNMVLKKAPFTLRNYRTELLTIGGVIMVLLVLCTFDILSIYPDNSVPYNIVKELPQTFWTEIKHLGVQYHIVLPVEGLLLISVIFIYFCISLTQIHVVKSIE